MYKLLLSYVDYLHHFRQKTRNRNRRRYQTVAYSGTTNTNRLVNWSGLLLVTAGVLLAGRLA